MSHELSETLATPAGFGINVSGHTGRMLAPQFGFERNIYGSPQMADAAAAARSNLFGQLVDAIQNRSMQEQRLGLPVQFVPEVSGEGAIQAYQHALPQPIHGEYDHLPKIHRH